MQSIVPLLVAILCIGCSIAYPSIVSPGPSSIYYAGTPLVVTIVNYTYDTPYDLYLMLRNDNNAAGNLLASNLPYYTTEFVYDIPLSQPESENYYVDIVYNCSLPLMCQTNSYLFTIVGDDQSSSSDDGISNVRIAEYIVGGAICGCVATLVVGAIAYAILSRTRRNYSPIA